MSTYNIIMIMLAGGLIFYSIYFFMEVIYVYKKIRDKHFYYSIGCLFISVFVISSIYLSTNMTNDQYLLLHRIKWISVNMAFPFISIILYECYFPNAKKVIPIISFVLMPIFIIIMPTNYFLTFPIHTVPVKTFFVDITYHTGKQNIFYIINGIIIYILITAQIIQYILSKKYPKEKPFIIMYIILFICFSNDLAVNRGLYNNIFTVEIIFVIMYSFIFFEFVKENRKTHFAVVDLSKELQRNKEDLEIKVIERTKELSLEKEKTDELYKKTEQLLLNVLPEQIAIRLKQGEQPIADHFDEASVIFIDIADFTKLSAKSTPQKMVNMLNEVFSIFDKISAKYGLEKIKTIGDCYMAAAGIPVRRDGHAEAVSAMAIEAMQTMKDYRTEDGHEIKFRIGLDCGPIVAGVIGEQKFIYDLWGDMVNTASRMETHGIVGRIQCTSRFHDKLLITNDQLLIKFEERGEIEIKGKGMMKTYFLVDSR